MAETKTPARKTPATPIPSETRKARAAARKAAEAGQPNAAVWEPTPTKAAPAKKAPAKAAPAAKKATPAARKLRWTLAAPKVDNKPEEQSASAEGHDYAIERSGEAWRATHTYEGTTEVLVEGGFGAAYTAAVKHNRERA